MPSDDAALASALGGASPAAARDWADTSLEEAREMHAFLSGIGGVGATEILDFAETFRRPGEVGRERARLFLEVETAFARGARRGRHPRGRRARASTAGCARSRPRPRRAASWCCAT